MRPSICITRHGSLNDLGDVKRIADAYRNELGFVNRAALERSIERGELLVAEQDGQIIGFVEYHIRRDKQLTLYHIAVEPAWQRHGAGHHLLQSLRTVAKKSGCTFILLKCPADLAANRFYESQGYKLLETLNDRKRPLNVWVLLGKGEAVNESDQP